MQIGLLRFIYNCLNIIPWGKKSTSTTVLSWHPHQKSVIMDCGWSPVVEGVEYPQSPAFSLQHPKGRQWPMDVLTHFWVLASIWLITSMPVSCCFSRFCFAVSFGNHEHEFSSFVLSQDSFSYSQVRFPNSPQCARTWSGHSDGSPVEYAEQSQALSPYRLSSDPRT